MPKNKPVYVGDKRTKEFHSIKRQKPQCNVKRITSKHQVMFQRGRDAKDANFDACFFCARHWKSRK